MKLDFDLFPAQNDFYETAARFPAFVGGVGTGKTMVGLMRVKRACEKYAGITALVVRKTYTDLAASTIRDYERYTGLKVDSDKNSKLPNGSLIMFRHGAELDTLKNINLGCFLIEQAEEFDTDEQFQMLRYRLRQETMPHHWGAVIANTNGHNWVWHLWKRPNLQRNPDFELYEATSFDNPNLPEATIADWRKQELEKPRLYRQYVMNSWDDYGSDAMFWAEQMSKARRDGRIANLAIDGTRQVFRVWDIGTVHIACWIGQVVDGWVNFINYYHHDDTSLGLPEAIKAVRAMPYVCYGDYCGPDIAKGAVNGKTAMNTVIIDEAAKLGVNLIPVPDVGLVDGIEAGRVLLKVSKFHDVNCADGIECLDNYKRMPKKSLSTPDNPEYAEKEVHDWASHGGSSFRYAGVIYMHGWLKDSRVRPVMVPGSIAMDDKPYSNKVLQRGLRRAG